MSNRRVLIIAPNFPPVVSAGIFRTLRFVKHLPEFGWQPIVLAGEPPYKNLQNADLPEGLIIHRVSWETAPGRPPANSNPNATRPPAHRPDRPGPLRRVLRPANSLLRNCWQLLRDTPDKHSKWRRAAYRQALQMVREYKPDVLYTSGPPHSVHLIGRQLKLTTDLPWIADFRDPWARAPWGQKPSNPWGQRLWPRLERRCVETADQIVLNTPRMAEDFRTAYQHLPPKFTAIPNGWDADAALRIEAHQHPLGSERAGRPLICHAGSCYRQRDPRPLLTALKLLADEGSPLAFRQIGTCASPLQIPRFVQELGLAKHIELIPTVPHDQALAHLAAADILLLLQPGTPMQVPGKLFEMLLFEKPILAICDPGDTADIVRRHRLGLVASPSDATGIATAIRQLLEHRSHFVNHEGWQNARREFNGRDLTRRLAELFDASAGGVEHPAPGRPLARSAAL